MKILLLVLKILHKLGLIRMALSKFIGTKVYGLKGAVGLMWASLDVFKIIWWILSFWRGNIYK